MTASIYASIIANMMLFNKQDKETKKTQVAVRIDQTTMDIFKAIGEFLGQSQSELITHMILERGLEIACMAEVHGFGKERQNLLEIMRKGLVPFSQYLWGEVSKFSNRLDETKKQYERGLVELNSEAVQADAIQKQQWEDRIQLLAESIRNYEEWIIGLTKKIDENLVFIKKNIGGPFTPKSE